MTTFHALYQGIHEDDDGDASLIAVFSTEKLAEDFRDALSKLHTEMKRVANDAREVGLKTDPVPDLYWDIRPISFDPRDVGELL